MGSLRNLAPQAPGEMKMNEPTYPFLYYSPEETVGMLKCLGYAGGMLFEKIIDDIAKLVITPGSCVVDGGSNRDQHSGKFMECVGKEGVVYSIEVIPELCEAMRAKYDGHDNCRVINVALWNAPDLTMDFNWVVNRDSLSGFHVYLPRDFSAPETRILRVYTSTIDSILKKESRRCSFIKLDVEGAEYAALRGGARVLGHDRPLIIFEDGRQGRSEQYGYQVEDVYNFFRDQKYSLLSILGHYFTDCQDYCRWNVWNTIAVPDESLLRIYPYIMKAVTANLFRHILGSSVNA